MGRWLWPSEEVFKPKVSTAGCIRPQAFAQSQCRKHGRQGGGGGGSLSSSSLPSIIISLTENEGGGGEGGGGGGEGGEAVQEARAQ